MFRMTKLGMTKVKTFNVKLPQKAKLIYFSTTNCPFGFPDHLFHMFFTTFFCTFSLCTMYGSHYISSYYCRYHWLVHSPLYQNFDSYFLVFKKCEVTPHHVCRDSLTLRWFMKNFTGSGKKLLKLELVKDP